MGARVAVVLGALVAASLALAFLARLRSEGSVPSRGAWPGPLLRPAPAGSLRRVIEEDERWLRRRPPSSPRAAGPATPLRNELGPLEAPVKDARVEAPAERPHEEGVTPVPQDSTLRPPRGFRVRSHPRQGDARRVGR